MAKEEVIEIIKAYRDKLINSVSNQLDGDIKAFDIAIQELSQEPCDKCVYSTKDDGCQYDDITETIPPLEPCEDARNMNEIAEIMKSDVDADTKCKMIDNIINSEPHYFKSQQPCEDAVSREAILSKIKEVCFSEKWLQFRVDKGSNGQRDFLINYIRHLPSVNPQYTGNEFFNFDAPMVKKSMEQDTVSREDINNLQKYRYNCGDTSITCVSLASINELPPVTVRQSKCLKEQAKKQAIPMSCDDCCYEPNSPFCHKYRKDICGWVLPSEK